MTLAEALGLDGVKIVSLVGGGGKTSSLFRLGRELTAQGKKVVLATTARMFEPDPGQIRLIIENQPGIGSKVAAVLAQEEQVLVGAGIEGGKLIGLSCELLLEIAAQPEVDIVIVEADGSRGRPLKFPAGYEPVICSSDTLVVPVMGITGLEMGLDDASFHRLELALEYMTLEEKITPKLAAAVLLHPRSYGRFLNTNRVVPLINQVETREQQALAWALAKELLQYNLDRVLIGAVQTSRPVLVVHRDEEEE